MNSLRVAVGCIVTAVWSIGYVGSYLSKDIKAPAEATPVMLGVVAYLFARELRARNGEGGPGDRAAATEEEG